MERRTKQFYKQRISAVYVLRDERGQMSQPERWPNTAANRKTQYEKNLVQPLSHFTTKTTSRKKILPRKIFFVNLFGEM